MATSGYIKNIYYQNLVVCGSNNSSDPNLHVFEEKEANPELFGYQSKLISYVSEEKMISEFVVSGYEPHNRTESWCFAGDYLQPKEKIPKKNRKCAHEGIEGVLALVK